MKLSLSFYIVIFSFILLFSNSAFGQRDSRFPDFNTEYFSIFNPYNVGKHGEKVFSDLCGYTDKNGREYALQDFYIVEADTFTMAGLVIVDITDPQNPSYITTVAGVAAVTKDIKTYGEYAYVIGGSALDGVSKHGLQIIDLSDLPNTAHTVNTDYSLFETADNLFIDNGYAYIVGGGIKGMLILDLTDPVNPSRKGFYYSKNSIYDVYVWDNYAVASMGWEGRYDLIDLSNKEKPRKVSSSPELSGIFAQSGRMTEDKKYFIGTDENKLRNITIWEVNLNSKWDLVVDKFDLPVNATINSLEVKGDYVHCSFIEQGYVVIDISNPLDPILAAHYKLSGDTELDNIIGCYSSFESGNTIISDRQNGLYILKFNSQKLPQFSDVMAEISSNNEKAIKFSAEIYSNNNIAEVNMFYRTRNNLAKVKTYLQRVSAFEEGGRYVCYVESYSESKIFDYYFAAIDVEGNISTFPAGGFGTSPTGRISPEEFITFPENSGQPLLIESFMPQVKDTTVTLGDVVNFSVNVSSNSNREPNYAWLINGGLISNEYSLNLNTIDYFNETTLYVKFIASDGSESVIQKWIIELVKNDKKHDIKAFKLAQNYPNPFNPSTTISYEIPEQTNVKIRVYDAIGKEVALLVNEAHSPGSYSVNFDASHLPSGLYFCQTIAGNNTAIRKMILVK